MRNWLVTPPAATLLATVQQRALGRAMVRVDVAGTGRLVLPGEPESVAAARRFVRRSLEAADRNEWVDAATLAVSELVTNSVLHAHSNVQLSVQVAADHVRIEVLDRSGALPIPRTYDATASTGRGLELVAAVSFDYGVEPLDGDGKVVWCCVNGAIAETLFEPNIGHEWADPESPGLAPSTAESLTVTLLDLPPTLWMAVREHHDALLRELALVDAGTVGAEAEALHGDLAAADVARRRIGDAVAAAVELSRGIGTAASPLPAHHPGELPSVPAVIDLQISVGHGEVDLFARLQDVLDRAERLAHAGRLLAKPGLPEVVAVRDWACEQVIAQVAGSPPAPWIGADDDRFAAAPAAQSTAGWSGAQVIHSRSGMIAVDDANRIVAVSRSLAQLLKWEPADLTRIHRPA